MQYLLDIETLLLFLGSRRQSGELTTILKHFPGLTYKGPCRVRLTLAAGKVTSCLLQNEEGQALLKGESVLLGLKKMGQLDWSWQAASRPDTISASAPAQRNPPHVWAFVYRRLVPIELIERSMLTRKQWQVLLLVDGSRTVAQIANLLLPSPTRSDMQEVSSILSDLQQRGMIALTRM